MMLMVQQPFLLALLVVFVLIFLILLYYDVKKPDGFPPGPRWLPFIGNFIWFRMKIRKLGFCHSVLGELAKEYGEVTGFRLGSMLMVAVSGSEAVRDVLTRDDFDGRPDGFLFRFRTFNQRLGIALTDGELWKRHRKFCVRYFRSRDAESLISLEARELIAHVREKNSLDGACAFVASVANVAWTSIAGDRRPLDDAHLRPILEHLHRLFRLVDFGGGIVNQLPWLRFVAPDYCGFTSMRDTLNDTYRFLQQVIDEKKSNLSASVKGISSNNGFIDAFLMATENNKKTKSNDYTSFTEKQLMSICLDLLMAGSETTSNTLAFAMLYMINYPHVQKKVQKELDDVLGKVAIPTLNDRSRLPYTEAVLMETQRITTVAPLGVPHRAVRETKLMGYRIPKDTVVIVNIHSVHMDPRFWEYPHQFRPERFLKKDKRTNNIHFIPFGLGKRRCLGEALAKDSLFLFFTAILYNFEVVSEEESSKSFDIYDGLTISPKPFKVSFIPRN